MLTDLKHLQKKQKRADMWRAPDTLKSKLGTHTAYHAVGYHRMQELFFWFMNYPLQLQIRE